MTAAVAICSTARWPLAGWSFSLVDLRYYADIRAWRGRLPEMTGVDAAYCTGLLLWALVAAAWSLRLILRQISLLRYRVPRIDRSHFWRPTAWVLLWLLLALGGIGLGWPYRIGQRWVANVLEESKRPQPNPWVAAVPELRPVLMTTNQELIALRSIIRQGNKPAKSAAIQLLLDTHNRDVTPVLIDALSHESELEFKVIEIRLLGIYAEPEAASILAALLEDHQAQVRQAAADAVSIFRDAEPKPQGGLDYGRAIIVSANPTIVVPWYFKTSKPDNLAIAYSSRDTLEKLMLAAETASEREAAARALVNWPPSSYHLRLAEWGVFMADSGGDIKFAQAQLDEIPPFVHRIGNPAQELKDRITINAMPIWKPVIHLTADTPMAVDLEVCISDGRPWLCYPRIDDLSVTPKTPIVVSDQKTRELYPGLFNGTPSPSELLDPSRLPSLSELRTGYPWTTAMHEIHNGPTIDLQKTSKPDSLHLIAGIGVRWQSIIVSPTQLSWMMPTNVGADPRFAWWKRLREVNCSWVANRGESERFLYYDGPTNRKSPVRARIDSGRLEIKGAWLPIAPGLRRGLYLEVSPRGVASKWIDHLHDPLSLDISNLNPQPPEAVIATFASVVESRGLTHNEAAGLVDCWRPAFFETPGRRFLLFMSPEDYDVACPMRIRPQPTEKARVGIVWTELQ
jgi:hypothetical protein